MSRMILPMELYTAARETCLRLYVANGGNPRDQWSIQPYPGTAAIARKPLNQWEPNASHWVLCMPAMPLDVRLPRWKGDLIAAYTVHELLHALWTNWNAVAQSRAENLGGLVNALEDNRIEGKASRGALTMVSEARKLLMALNDHIVRRAMANVLFRFDDPAQFSFVLNLVLFAEKLSYVSALPLDWKVNPRSPRVVALVRVSARAFRRSGLDARLLATGARSESARSGVAKGENEPARAATFTARLARLARPA